MKYIKTFEQFLNESISEAKKEYGEQMDPDEFAKIKKGDKVQYMGTQMTVIANDGFVLDLKDKKGRTTLANLNQFSHGGRIAESAIINEGQFSWMTQDTGEQIGSEIPNTITVYMFDDEGNMWEEKKYEGYGEFGGKDYYDLVATMNGYPEDRQIGIDLAFDKIKTKRKDTRGKVLFFFFPHNKRYNWKRHDFTEEAESDPDQSWYVDESVKEARHPSGIQMWVDQYRYDSTWVQGSKPLSYPEDITIEEIAKQAKGEWAYVDATIKKNGKTMKINFRVDDKNSIEGPYEEEGSFKKLKTTSDEVADYIHDY